MASDLTEAQYRALVKASKPGGVVGFGQKYKVVGPLHRLGFVTPIGRNGYMAITPEGVQALKKQDRIERMRALKP